MGRVQGHARLPERAGGTLPSWVTMTKGTAELLPPPIHFPCGLSL